MSSLLVLESARLRRHLRTWFTIGLDCWSWVSFSLVAFSAIDLTTSTSASAFSVRPLAYGMFFCRCRLGLPLLAVYQMKSLVHYYTLFIRFHRCIFWQWSLPLWFSSCFKFSLFLASFRSTVVMFHLSQNNLELEIYSIYSKYHFVLANHSIFDWKNKQGLF